MMCVGYESDDCGFVRVADGRVASQDGSTCHGVTVLTSLPHWTGVPVWESQPHSLDCGQVLGVFS